METIQYAVEDGVATITLNRPAQKNALEFTMFDALGKIVTKIRDDRNVKAVIITGAQGTFCAGGDLRDIAGAGLDAEGWRSRLHELHRWLADLITLDRPVIAAVDGAAYGAGFSLALCADFILATPRARFSMAFLRVGAIPDCGAFYTLPRVVGAHRAKELMLSCREVGSEEARDLGIVFEIDERVFERAQALASSFVHAPTAAVSIVKRAIDASLTSNLHAMLELEADGQAIAFGTEYHRDAVARFTSKKPLAFVWPPLPPRG